MRRLVVPVTAAGLAAGFLLGVDVAGATFTSATANGTNRWDAGQLVLSDSRGGNTSTGATGTAVFATATNMQPGDSDERCIRVTYASSIPATVSLHVSAAVDTGDADGVEGLAAHLRLSVDQADAGTAADCADFSGNVTNLYNANSADDTKTVAAFPGAGVTSYTNATSGSQRTYRIRWFLLPKNAAEGNASKITFTWRATMT